MKNWNINFFAYRKYYFTISIMLIVVTLACALVFGINLDIQFKGGALLTYSYTGDLDASAFQKAAEKVLGQSVSMQESTDIATGKQNIVLSLPTSEGIDAERQAALAAALNEQFSGNEIETASISVVNPTIGGEFLAKCLVAIGFAALLMVFYVSFRFRRIGGWSAGVTAVIALVHDILMVFAVFVVGRISLNANFIAVCLTILGYSLNDTIVIYDRIRENRRIYGASMPVEDLVNLSLNQSMTRSLLTSVTTASAMIVVSLVALLYNVNTILSFSFPMIIGMVSGFYSSVCIAPALWTMWQKKKAA
ncbi:protein translocase subunit SecF [Yanshouia hominis]|uniref:Protein-export membrane protein SecF n=1 Tax=Yanshouia hominis TaxID=2763673 RepID=A0ABR7NI18_9FIRM|nr:protein translocase subunit SecF [Yanshouia hominis]MBC8576052.1 protein translocase subunit SecF [Yanshouia hominis]